MRSVEGVTSKGGVTSAGWMTSVGRMMSEVRAAAPCLTARCLVVVAALASCTPARDAPPADGPAVGPSDEFATADSIVDDWVRSDRVAGASLVVLEQGQTVHTHTGGVLQRYRFGEGQYPSSDGVSPRGIVPVSDSVPVTVETLYDLASVTKVLATTMAVMLLVDRELLDLDAPLSDLLPDYESSDRDEITPRHLLTHTSGLPQWWPVYYHAEDRDAAWEWLRRQDPTWPVGAERHYSDLGFMVLGRIVESITGDQLDQYLDRELYGPLGVSAHFRPGGADLRGDPANIAATSHGNPFERRMVHDPDFGYSIELDPASWDGWRMRTLVGEVNDGNAWHAFQGVAGHAGLFATATDAASLVQLLIAGGDSPGGRFIEQGTVDTFLAPHAPGQALGWQLPDYAPEGSFGHTGFTGTFVLGVPELNRVIVLLTHRQNPGVDADTQYSDVGPLQRAVTRALTTSPTTGG